MNPEPTLSSLEQTMQRFAGGEPAMQIARLWAQGPAEPPDLERFLAGFPSLTGSEVAQVLCVDQAERWRRGQSIRAEEYLERYPTVSADDEAAIDLIYSEFVARQQSGDTPRIEEYLERFPAYADRLKRLLQLDQLLVGDSRLDVDESTLQSPAPLLSGILPDAIGKYRVISLLGKGGQARVYRAVHPTLGQDVVIKLARQPALPEQREPLLAEGRILAGLNHPHLARVFDLDFHEERAFLVMEYVQGVSLQQVALHQRIPPERAGRMVAVLARALALAHSRGVVHLDIKPANILLGEDGEPRLIDFGLARMSDAWRVEGNIGEGVFGTLPFMPPEQALAQRDRIGPQSDVFALGGVLYFLLTGHAPFPGKTMTVALDQARRCDWDREALAASSAPAGLKAVCARALSAEPADRYLEAGALADALESCIRPRRRWPVLLAGAVALLLLAGLTAVVWPGLRRPALPPVSGPTAADARREALLSGTERRLQVRVLVKKRLVSLTNRAPLRTGDRLRVDVEAPADLHLALFLFDSDGRLERLADWAPTSEPRRLGFPTEQGDFVPLTGSPGTEFFLLVGRREGPVTKADLRACWPEGDRWPTLPDPTVLRLWPSKVHVEQDGRGVGAPEKQDNPQVRIERLLEDLRLALRQRLDYFEGLAVAHGAAR